MFFDRRPTRPNRYKITPESGTPYYAKLERADEPVSEGTALNAATFNATIGAESTDFPGCRYRTVNGETEWINPPMVEGVEYRTAERYDGMPVYTKRLVFGDMPTAAGDRTAVDAFSLNYQCVDVCGFISLPGHQAAGFPFIGSAGNVIAWLSISDIWAGLYPEDYSGATVVLNAGTDLSRYTAECTVKYVKG